MVLETLLTPGDYKILIIDLQKKINGKKRKKKILNLLKKEVHKKIKEMRMKIT